MAYDINVIQQGLYKVPVKVKTAEANYKFLQNVLFGGPSVSSNDDFIGIDTESYGIKLSADAIKGADPTRVNYGKNFNEKAIFGLYFNDEDQVGVDQGKNRVSMNEPIEAPWTLEERLTYLLAEKRDLIIASHEHTLEKACADAALTGSFTAREGSQTFPMTSGLLSVSGANLTTKPVETLTAGAKLVLKKTGARPTMLVMNPDDAVKFLSASAVASILDNKRVMGNEAWYKAIDENGASYCGTISVPGIGALAVISYFGGYDNNGTYTYFIPAGKAIMAPANIGCKGYCGVYVKGTNGLEKTAMDHGVYAWDETTHLPGTLHVQVQSAPAPIITAIDRYCVFTGIA